MTVNEALGAHDFILDRYGGLAGIRDLGAIESAIARPYCGYYRRIEQKGAALVHSLTLNHGFVDGNKRTAIVMLGILLFRSGYALGFPTSPLMNRQVEAMALAVAQHQMEFGDVSFGSRSG